MKVAFYKGTRPGIQGIYSRLVRLWTRGDYSHAELVFSDGIAASSSFLDGGVRLKRIEFSAENWDIIDLPGGMELNARKWFEGHCGAKYDIWGNVRFVVGFLPNSGDKFFCSEAIAAALGIGDPWRYDPNVLFSTLAHYAIVK